MTQNAKETVWPELPLAAWRDTYAALHLWTQIVGKVRFELTPWLNHSWSVALYVTPRGLGTGKKTREDSNFFPGSAVERLPGLPEASRLGILRDCQKIVSLPRGD